jgi:hypothetical protein
MTTISTVQIRANAITSAKIATGAIDTATQIAAGTITATQVDTTSIATRSYVDTNLTGLRDFKDSVLVATNATDELSNSHAEIASGYNFSSGVITATLATTDSFTIDGVTLTSADDGERILIKTQDTNAQENGIYTSVISGTSLTLTRSTDFDSATDITLGAYVFVLAGGTSHGNTGWILSSASADPVVVDTSTLTFTQFLGNGAQSLTTLSDVTLSGVATTEFLVHDGTDFKNVAMGGDATMANDGTLTLAANSVDSAEITSGSIDLAHMSVDSIDSDQYVDGSIDLIHMSANSVDSDQYVDGSIDLIHMSADSVDGTKMADNAVDSEHYTDNSIDEPHINWNADYTGDGISAKDIPLTTTGQTYTYAGPETDIHEAIALISNNWQPAVAGIQTGSGDDPGQVAGTRYIVTDVGSLHANFGTIGGTPANGDIVINTATGINWTLAVDVSAFGEGIMTWVDSANKIYQWDNSTWSALASSVSSLGDLSDIVGGGTYTAGGLFIADGTNSYDLTALGGNVSMGADGVVAVNSVQANAVVTASITALNVTAAKLATDAVETAKIKDANVTAAKLTGPASALQMFMHNGTSITTVTQAFNEDPGETPTGTDGTDGLTAFSVANTPVANSQMVFNNGILQTVTTDYTISGANITFVTPNIPVSGDIIRVSYTY